MNIDYSYVIGEVNTDNNTMMVTYSSDGLETVTVGTRLPFTGEPLEECIHLHAPFGLWALTGATYDTVAQGVSGTIPKIADPTPAAPETLEEAKDRKKNEVSTWRDSNLGQIVVSNGIQFNTDHLTLNTLRSIKDNMADGIYTTVSFKSVDGQFYTLDQDSVSHAISEVALNLQSLYDQEREKAAEIDALTDISAVDAYAISNPQGQGIPVN